MWEKIKKQAYELVLWAEVALAKKSGPEKRKAVVNKMCEVINWPFVPDFIERIFEPVLYGWVIDKICGVLNIVTDHGFEGLALSDDHQAKVLELVTMKDGVDVIPGPEELEVAEPELCRGSVDDRLAALYQKYVSK